MVKNENFKCFNDKDGYVFGHCRHQEPPADGVWKISPENLRLMEDECAKYEGLVWYARRTEGNDQVHVKHIEDRYPKETKELNSKRGSWVHGYNSGMLAAYRLALGLAVGNLNDTSDSDFAIENYPELDS